METILFFENSTKTFELSKEMLEFLGTHYNASSYEKNGERRILINEHRNLVNEGHRDIYKKYSKQFYKEARILDKYLKENYILLTYNDKVDK